MVTRGGGGDENCGSMRIGLVGMYSVQMETMAWGLE